MRHFKTLLLLTGLLSGIHATLADTLLVDAVREHQQQQQQAGLPTRGMTMAQVLNRFGEPAQKRAPVGEPPISQWRYDHFVVYFERQYVIHAVVPHQGSAD